MNEYDSKKIFSIDSKIDSKNINKKHFIIISKTIYQEILKHHFNITLFWIVLSFELHYFKYLSTPAFKIYLSKKETKQIKCQKGILDMEMNFNL